MKFFVFMALVLGTACLILLSGFALPTVTALLILVSAVTADFYTTWRWLKERGREGNPMIAFLFKKLGVYKSFGLLAGLWVFIIVFRWLPAPEGIQTAVALSYWLVPVNNILALMKLMRRNYAS